MKEGIRFSKDEVQKFIDSNVVTIDMCKRQARIEKEQYEESIKRNAQSKIGKVISQDNIRRRDLQSIIGTLNTGSGDYYKECLRKLLKQIPNITDEIIDDILFNS